MYDLALEETGIRSTQFTILVAIRKHQPVSIGTLGDILILDRTTLTRSLRLLKNAGLIAISDRSTRRQRFLTLTSKGGRTLARSLPEWRKVHERFVATVGSHHWIDLRNELERLAHVVSDLEKTRGHASAMSSLGS
jgi:DNA-binding MarR family transcriptional regulator